MGNMEKIVLKLMIAGGLEIVQEALVILKGNQDHFADINARNIFNTILTMQEARAEIGVLTVTSVYKQKYGAEADGKHIASIMSMETHGVSVQSACELLINETILRAAKKIMQSGYGQVVAGGNGMAIVNDTMQNLTGLLSENLTSSQVRIDDDAVSIKAKVRKIKKMRDEGILPGVISGLNEFDRLLGGFKPCDLGVIAARPGCCKTSTVLTYALNAAKMGTPILIFSLEMDKYSLTCRLAAQASGLDLFNILNGKLNDTQLLEFDNAVDYLGKLPLYIDDKFDLDLFSLRSKLRMYKDQYGIKCAFIDYLQLMKAPDKAGSREREVALMTRELKKFAKEFNIPIVILCQLNRALENRPNKEPILSDLRESGAIEQDADVVVFLHRPELYDKENPAVQNKIDFIVAKHRNGAVGSARMKFVKQSAKIDNDTLEYDNYYMCEPVATARGLLDIPDPVDMNDVPF